MLSTGLFTTADLRTISRAAALAEKLTQVYFDLAPDEWKVNPYTIFTHKQMGPPLYEQGVFAQVIRYQARVERSKTAQPGQRETYGVVLLDPNILLALLRSTMHDLWTLGLFILTHELTHIIRFRKCQADFFAPVEYRDREEKRVHGITQEILAGVTNTDHILGLYENRLHEALRIKPYHPSHGGGANADL
ncbi:MAG: hypothetical protein WBG50_03000 [Desulfomonilaceae bacterium]